MFSTIALVANSDDDDEDGDGLGGACTCRGCLHDFCDPGCADFEQGTAR